MVPSGCSNSTDWSRELLGTLFLSRGKRWASAFMALTFLNEALLRTFHFLFFIYLFIFLLFRAEPAAYANSQARCRIATVAAGLCQTKKATAG